MNQSAISMLQKSIELMTKETCTELMPDMIAPLLTVRRLRFFACLVVLLGESDHEETISSGLGYELSWSRQRIGRKCTRYWQTCPVRDWSLPMTLLHWASPLPNSCLWMRSANESDSDRNHNDLFLVLGQWNIQCAQSGCVLSGIDLFARWRNASNALEQIECEQGNHWLNWSRSFVRRTIAKTSVEHDYLLIDAMTLHPWNIEPIIWLDWEERDFLDRKLTQDSLIEERLKFLSTLFVPSRGISLERLLRL